MCLHFSFTDFRDISFLYDVPKSDKKIEKSSNFDVGVIRKKNEKKDSKVNKCFHIYKYYFEAIIKTFL